MGFAMKGTNFKRLKTMLPLVTKKCRKLSEVVEPDLKLGIFLVSYHTRMYAST